jgi:hypothetical protein
VHRVKSWLHSPDIFQRRVDLTQHNLCSQEQRLGHRTRHTHTSTRRDRGRTRTWTTTCRMLRPPCTRGRRANLHPYTAGGAAKALRTDPRCHSLPECQDSNSHKQRCVRWQAVVVSSSDMAMIFCKRNSDKPSPGSPSEFHSEKCYKYDVNWKIENRKNKIQ